MRRFFTWYQFIVPIIFLPIVYYLWLLRYDNNNKFVLIIFSVPIIMFYVMPGIGTNYLRLWEFNTRFRLGKFRPHHGFVFGTGISLLVFLSLNRFTGNEMTSFDYFQAGFVGACVFGFWNWIYDLYAIKSGFMTFYTKKYSEGATAEEIATDYAPQFFGTMGFCYFTYIRACESFLLIQGKWEYYWEILICGLLWTMITPIMVYILNSYIKHGESGLRSYKDQTKT